MCQNAHVHVPGTLTAVIRLSGYRWGALISSLQNKPKASSNHSALPPIMPVCHLLSLPWIPAFDRVQILPLSFILVIETPSWKRRKGGLPFQLKYPGQEAEGLQLRLPFIRPPHEDVSRQSLTQEGEEILSSRGPWAPHRAFMIHVFVGLWPGQKRPGGLPCGLFGEPQHSLQGIF